MTSDDRLLLGHLSRHLVTTIGENELFRKIIHIWLYIPVVYAIPFLLLLFINVLTIRLLHRFYVHRRRHLHLTSAISTQNHEQHERDITWMLIGVVLLFFICRFPMLINHVFEKKLSLTSYVDHDKKSLGTSTTYGDCRSRRLFNTVVNFLQAINASANLFFYYLFGESFRDTSVQLARLVRKRAIRRKNTMTESISYYIQRRRPSGTVPQPNQTPDQQQFSNLLHVESDDVSKKTVDPIT